jgi:serine/threonine protein kinase/dipeptidyl aminopeptidase/acylaminoacyl peptidase
MLEPPPGMRVGRFGPFEVNLTTGELRKHGIRLKLQEQPFQVLAMLLARPGKLVTREEIHHRLWPSGTFVDFDNGLNTALCRLREALGDSAESPRYIETLARRGYRWMVAVDWMSSRSADLPAAVSVEAPSEAEATSDNLIGKKISHYRVLGVLGGGGMGVVYRAEDIKLGRGVALKFLPEELAHDLVALERFEREARAASALNHPHICTIYEFEEYEGQPFIVMELLDGQTLRERLANASEQLQMNELLDLAIQITDGLDAAHQKGIIHRDIKTANIFLTNRGEAKILDFGLAKITDLGEHPHNPLAEDVDETFPPRESTSMPSGISTLTHAGAMIGTVSYMSPEQVRGGKLDSRTDLFSFGLVLYEMATGQRAFRGNTVMQVNEAILHGTPAPAREWNAELPPELELIIDKALQKDREMRYHSASELRTDLKRLRRNTESGRSSAISQPRASAKSVPRWLAITSVTVVVLILTGIFFVASRWTHMEVKRDPVPRELTANPPENPISGYAISPDGKYLAYSDRANGLALLQIDTGQTRPFPNTGSLDPLDWFPDGNHLLAGRSISVTLSEIWKMSTWDGTTRKLQDGASNPVVSPDGTRIAYLNDYPATQIWTMGPDGEDPRRIASADPGTEYTALNWSPTGQRLLYVLEKVVTDKSPELKIETCNLDGGQRTVVLSDLRLMSDITWLPDGRVLFTLREPPPNKKDVNIWAIQVDTHTGRARGKPSRVTNWTGFTMNDFSHSADGKRLVFLRKHEHDVVKIAENRSNGGEAETSRRLNVDNWNNQVGAWTSDSQNVLLTSDRNGKWGIYKQNLHEPDAHALVSGSENYGNPEISPDGKWLFYIASVSTNDNDPSARVMRMPLDGGPTTVVLAGLHHYSCSRSPARVCAVSELRGKELVFSFLDQINGLGREIARVEAEPNYQYRFRLSPDGKRIALLPNGGNQIRIVSIENGSVRTVSPKGWDNLQSVSWSSDGNRLYVNGWTAQSEGIVSVDMEGNVRVMIRVKWHQTWVHGPLASPDGHHLAYDQRDYESSVTMLENF